MARTRRAVDDDSYSPPRKRKRSTHADTTRRRMTRKFVTTESARHVVLSTNELLEHIIVHLPPRNIFGVQRVTKRFKEVIETSPDIQWKLFLRLREPATLLKLPGDQAPPSIPPPPALPGSPSLMPYAGSATPGSLGSMSVPTLPGTLSLTQLPAPPGLLSNKFSLVPPANRPNPLNAQSENTPVVLNSLFEILPAKAGDTTFTLRFNDSNAEEMYDMNSTFLDTYLCDPPCLRYNFTLMLSILGRKRPVHGRIHDSTRTGMTLRQAIEPSLKENVIGLDQLRKHGSLKIVAARTFFWLHEVMKAENEDWQETGGVPWDGAVKVHEKKSA